MTRGGCRGQPSRAALEFAVLGLLHEGPTHGYDLRRRLNTALGPFRALSYGTLYPALKGLLDRGLIAQASDPVPARGKRPRVVYELTAAGKEHFAGLVARSDASSWDDDGFDVRFAFFTRTERDVRIRILEGRRSRVEENLERVRGATPAAASASTRTPRPCSGTARRPPSARSAGSASSSTPNGATPPTPAPSRRCRARQPARTASVPPRPPPTPTSQEKPMGSIRVAVVGVGNCASSLVQGVHYYRDADPSQTVPGLMHVKFGEYHVSDVEFVAAFDVDDKKVGKDLAEAINASENNTIKIADVPTTGITVQRGHTLDGLGKYYRQTIDESGAEPVDVVATLRDAKVDVLVSYLPVGSENADKFYAQCAIDAGVAFVNALPVFIASDPEWAAKFEAAGVPVIGDDIKSQVGATITHRVMAKLFEDRGVQLDRTYQLNVGGNMDFKNMLERERLESKKISKTQAVTSNLTGALAGKTDDRNVHIGPSDYVAWLDDRKWAYVRLEGRAFGDVPLNLEYKLEVWDSPNSAGIIIDAIRAAKIAKDRGIGGALLSASSYLMKSPPEQRPDDLGRAKLEAFIRGEEER